jgi:hypothetical protein
MDITCHCKNIDVLFLLLKVIDNIWTIVENYISCGIKISRDNISHIMGLINNCTKENSSKFTLWHRDNM